MGTDPAAGPNKASKFFLQATTQVKRASCCGFPVSPTLGCRWESIMGRSSISDSSLRLLSTILPSVSNEKSSQQKSGFGNMRA
jgi:hypothetical protein